MHRTTLFHTALNVLVASIFVVIGLLFLVLPWISWLRRAAVDLIVGHPFNMTLLAMGFLAVGISMVTMLLCQRRQYYHLKTGDRAVMVSQNVLDQYVSDYWEKHFPDREFVSNVQVKDNQIHITADLPPLPFESQRSFLRKAEEDLSALLADRVGYLRGFSLSVSFFDLDTPSLPS